MDIRVKNLFLSFFLIIFLATPALAETRYIVDQLVVNLRDGKGNQYETIKTLKTGTALEILEEDATYVKVRTISGETGFVIKTTIDDDKDNLFKVNTHVALEIVRDEVTLFNYLFTKRGK